MKIICKKYFEWNSFFRTEIMMLQSWHRSENSFGIVVGASNLGTNFGANRRNFGRERIRSEVENFYDFNIHTVTKVCSYLNSIFWSTAKWPQKLLWRYLLITVSPEKKLMSSFIQLMILEKQNIHLWLHFPCILVTRLSFLQLKVAAWAMKRRKCSTNGRL